MANLFYTIVLVLACVGAINWGLQSAFKFNLVEKIFKKDSTGAKITYDIIGLAGVATLVMSVMKMNQTGSALSMSL